MQFLAKKYPILILLIFNLLTSSFAQENTFSFTWLDRSEKPMAGTLSCSLIAQPTEGQYQLLFSVTWFNQDGHPISDVNKMPVLSLSKYDFTREPSQNISCALFEQKKPSSLLFSTTESLDIKVLNGYYGEVKFLARFQYALTKDDYELGKSELIDVKGSKEVKMIFQVKSPKVVARPETIKPAINSRAMHSVSENYRKLFDRFMEVKGQASVTEIGRPEYLKDLDALTGSIETERSSIRRDSIPADSFQLYRERYSQLNLQVLDFRSEILKLKLATPVKSEPGSSTGQQIDDSLRNLIRSRFDKIVTGQLDSLDKLNGDQKAIALEISTLVADSKTRRKMGPRIDTLISNHNQLKKNFLTLQLSHENTWKSYSKAIIGLKPISEIENPHASFVAKQIDVQSAIDQLERGMAAVPADQETPWYLSTKLIWIGFLVVLIIVLISGIRNSVRNRKIIEAGLNTPEKGNSITQPGKSPAVGLFSSELPDEYFTLNYQETIPEAAVGMVHFNASSIKSVYHFVQAALLEKRGDDFGGYLFGNQYKLHGKGTSGSEIFIEKVCDSKYLRSSIPNEIGARTDLIEEMDQLMLQNKKLRLIGWFTSTADNSMEIPEGLMKVHRSFFKEKWQLGILLNPGSDVLQGAGFLRRRSGYLDPMPDPAAFIKWDELYRFALNPANSSKKDLEEHENDSKNYSRISLNNTWSDSLVTSVNFDPAVVSEIMAIAANQAIPKDTYQLVGYLYGKVVTKTVADGKPDEYDVFISRFIELANELVPRDLPGLTLVGWWGQSNVDVINYLHTAIDYHERIFREAFQFSCLVNPLTGELRIFTRKHSLEMNNSTIETEEYQLNSLLSR